MGRAISAETVEYIANDAAVWEMLAYIKLRVGERLEVRERQFSEKHH